MRLERSKLADRKITLNLNKKLFLNNNINLKEYNMRYHCIENNLNKGNTHYLQSKLIHKYKNIV